MLTTKFYLVPILRIRGHLASTRIYLQVLKMYSVNMYIGYYLDIVTFYVK
jgi:hypothetical protein